MLAIRSIGINSIVRSRPVLGAVKNVGKVSSIVSYSTQHSPDEYTNKKRMTVDHELPDPMKEKRRNQIVFISFSVLMSLALFGIFNYEKTSSPVMNATMYFLRRSELARSKLGKEITFAGLFPWIHGQLNTMVGNVDINVKVSGSKLTGTMVLKLARDSRHQEFKIEKWELVVGDEVINLLEDDSIDFAL